MERIEKITLKDRPKMINDLIQAYNTKTKHIQSNNLHLDGYGFKEPNSHIILERLMKAYPNMKYIHVIRNGLDMAFSENQNQVKLWGFMYMSKEDFSNINYASLKYWCIVHKRILKIGQRMGANFYLLNYERLCTYPNKELKKLCKFLNVDVRCSIGLKYLIEKPQSIGRFRQSDISIFDPMDVAFVKELGFDIK
jgi:hypothetical protein